MSEPVLVTGADGFVGRATCEALERAGFGVRRGVRGPREDAGWVSYGDLESNRAFDPVVSGCRAIIHVAGGVHVTGARAHDEAFFRRTNVDATIALARAARAAGVTRFVFVSTLGVHAPAEAGVVSEASAIGPGTPYAHSKREAEIALRGIEAPGFEVVSVRPPLVYGPSCPGNMARLARLLDKRVPLPLAAVENRRSLIGVENLAQALLLTVSRPGAAGQDFLVRDGQDVSTPQILRLLAEGLGTTPRLFALPVPFLKAIARIGGRADEIGKLTENL